MDIDELESFITTRRSLMAELENGNEENIRLIHELTCLKKENGKLMMKLSFENQDENVKSLINDKFKFIEAENNKLFDSINHLATLKLEEDLICKEIISPLSNLDLSYLFKRGNGSPFDFANRSNFFDNSNDKKIAVPFSLVGMVDNLYTTCFENWRFVPDKCYLSKVSIILTDGDSTWMTKDKKCIICNRSFPVSYGKTLKAACKPYEKDEVSYGILCEECSDSHPLIRAV